MGFEKEVCQWIIEKWIMENDGTRKFFNSPFPLCAFEKVLTVYF
jgi:hypothetical protein